MKTTVGLYAATARTSLAGARRARWLTLPGLLAALALAAPATAAAANPEMRGEWSLVISAGGQTAKGTVLIAQEANASGEFTAETVHYENGDQGTFSGTLGATEASVRLTANAFGGYPESVFTSSTMQINSSGSSPSLSGSGTITAGTFTAPATMTATRVRTYQEVKEREAQEKLEQEEAEMRENVRGEWALVLKSGPQTVNGTARITQVANASNEFASSSALFEGSVPGTFSGKLEGGKTSVTVVTQAAGQYPEATFTSSTMTLTSNSTSMSMSGSGTVSAGGFSAPATLTATRIKNYAQLKQQEAQEALEREAQARLEREAQEKVEREAREKLEAEAAAKKSSTSSTTTSTGSTASTTSTTQATDGGVALAVQLASNKLSINSTGVLPVELANPNTLAVHGKLTLLLPSAKSAGKAASAARKAIPKRGVVLGSASFTIPADGHVTVLVKLSRAGRALLSHRKSLSAIVKILAQADGQASVSTTYKLTLRAPSRSHHGH